MTYARDNWDEFAFGTNNTKFTIPKIEHNIFPKTNQWLQDETTSACTIFWAWNQIIRLFWLDLTMEEANKVWLEIVKYCTQFWYTIGYWWSTPDALNTVCKWWNTIWYNRYNKEKIFYEKLVWWDERIQEAKDKWHLIGFTYNLNRNQDRYKGLVDKDEYKWATWHRCNIKSPNLTRATSWLITKDAKEWVHDNYYIWTNEYYIKDIWKYVYKWVYWNFYIVLPQSCLEWSVEQVKQDIKELKAVNATIWVLSTTWSDLPEEMQNLASSYANTLRNAYSEARPLQDKDKKVPQWLVDILSYEWKYFDEEDQKKLAELASHLRQKYSVL